MRKLKTLRQEIQVSGKPKATICEVLIKFPTFPGFPDFADHISDP